jgi:putative transposase
MKRKQFSEEQIIGILKEAEAGAVVTDLCRRHGMSSATYCAWKAKFGGMEVSDAKRLRALRRRTPSSSDCLRTRCWTILS